MNYFSGKCLRICYSKCRKYSCQIFIALFCTLLCILLAIVLLQWQDYTNDELREFRNNSKLNSSRTEHQPPKIVSEVEKRIQEQRQYIKDVLYEAVFRPDRYGNLTRETYLSKFSMEEGGMPVITLLVSNWGSGATLITKILDKLPGMLSYSEPVQCVNTNMSATNFLVHDFTPLVEKATSLLRNLIHCNMTAIPAFVDCAIRGQVIRPIGDVCQGTRLSSCQNEAFINSRCTMAPFQTVKVLRINLKYFEEYLVVKNSYNLKMLYLIRDPRGIMNSRIIGPYYRRDCTSTDCNDPAQVCLKLERDFRAATMFSSKHPHKFRVIRYEDFVASPISYFKRVLDFLGFKMPPVMTTFLTNDVKNNAFQWRETLLPEQIFKIQNNCEEAIHDWGYKLIGEEKVGNMTAEFNPVGKSPFNL